MNIYNYFQSVIERGKLTSVYESKIFTVGKIFLTKVYQSALLKRTRKVQWIVLQSKYLRLTKKLELVKLTQSTVLVYWSLLTVFQYYMSKKSSMVLSYRSTGQLPTCHHDNTCTALTPIMDKDHRRNEYQSIHLGRISQILPGTEDSEGTEDKQDSRAREKMMEGEKLRVALPENYLQPLEAKALVHLSQKMGSTPKTHLKGKYRCMLITGYKRNI